MSYQGFWLTQGFSAGLQIFLPIHLHPSFGRRCFGDLIEIRHRSDGFAASYATASLNAVAMNDQIASHEHVWNVPDALSGGSYSSSVHDVRNGLHVEYEDVFCDYGNDVWPRRE